MISIEELLASTGVSMGAYGIYKVAMRFYNRYYINSECNRPTANSTDIIVHISEKEEKEEPRIEVMERGVEKHLAV
jgi:hypothetical protein